MNAPSSWAQRAGAAAQNLPAALISALPRPRASAPGSFGRRAIHLQETSITPRDIDARSIVTIIIFFIVNILVIFPVSIPLPLFLPRTWDRVFGRTETEETSADARAGESSDAAVAPAELQEKDTPAQANAEKDAPPAAASDPVSPPSRRRWRITLGLELAPPVGVLLLLASTCIDGGVLRNGIVGGEGVRPYDIMTLFISFAYIALSLDRTNLLRYLAFHVASRSASSGHALYAAFFGFFSLTGLLVGNDPLILSGTPFLAHFSRLAGITDARAYLFTQFQSANLVSALLVSSNPTNLVLSSGFGLSFLAYSAWLALPTVAATIVLYPTLRYWVFRREGMIPRTLTPPSMDPANALHDPWGAAFGGCTFGVTIVVLIALSAVGKLEGVEGVWTVTAPAALLILARDVAHDLMSKRTREEEVRQSSRAAGEERAAEDPTSMRDGQGDEAAEKPVKEFATSNGGPMPSASASSPGPSSRGSTPPNDITNGNCKAPASASAPLSRTPSATAAESRPSQSPSPSPTPASPSAIAKPATAPHKHRSINHRKSSPIQTFRARLPTVSWIIAHLPLTLIPFAFSMFILVESLSHVGWITVFARWWAAWCHVGGTAGGVAMMGLIGVLGCNIFGTNIGCVVLLSRVMQQWAILDQSISERTFYGSVFALAVGSNFGAYSLVFPASLAGLLWRTLLSQKGITITQRQFARWNAVPLVVTTIVACLVVAAEVCVMLPGN